MMWIYYTASSFQYHTWLDARHLLTWHWISAFHSIIRYEICHQRACWEGQDRLLSDRACVQSFQSEQSSSQNDALQASDDRSLSAMQISYQYYNSVRVHSFNFYTRCCHPNVFHSLSLHLSSNNQVFPKQQQIQLVTCSFLFSLDQFAVHTLLQIIDSIQFSHNWDHKHATSCCYHCQAVTEHINISEKYTLTITGWYQINSFTVRWDFNSVFGHKFKYCISTCPITHYRNSWTKNGLIRQTMECINKEVSKQSKDQTCGSADVGVRASYAVTMAW